MTASRNITTNFPLGLFCNATLSGELPRIKKTKTQNESIDPKNFPPVILEVDNIDETYWDDTLEA